MVSRVERNLGPTLPHRLAVDDHLGRVVRLDLEDDGYKTIHVQLRRQPGNRRALGVDLCGRRKHRCAVPSDLGLPPRDLMAEPLEPSVGQVEIGSGGQGAHTQQSFQCHVIGRLVAKNRQRLEERTEHTPFLNHHLRWVLVARGSRKGRQ